jgi:hypothetical protein
MTTSNVTVPQPKAADGDYVFLKHNELNAVVATVGTVGWPAGAQTAPNVSAPSNDLTGTFHFTAPTLTQVGTGQTTSPFPRPGARISLQIGPTSAPYNVTAQTPAAGQIQFTNNGCRINAVDAAAADHTAAFTTLDGTTGDVIWTLVALPV